jgi:hypothetical protein
MSEDKNAPDYIDCGGKKFECEPDENATGLGIGLLHISFMINKNMDELMRSTREHIKDIRWRIRREHKALEYLASIDCVNECRETCDGIEKTINKCPVCIAKDVIEQKDNLFYEFECQECGWMIVSIEQCTTCDNCKTQVAFLG